MGGKLRTEIIGHAGENVTNAVYTHVTRARMPPRTNSTRWPRSLVDGW
jgi:hypothetical protein